jgi:hypothetical protein
MTRDKAELGHGVEQSHSLGRSELTCQAERDPSEVGTPNLIQPHTRSGSAVPQAHMSGCRDSRQTSDSRHSKWEVGRAEWYRRAARPGTSSCCRRPGAGFLGPSCGPGHLCTHNVQLARSCHPAPGTLWGSGLQSLALVSRPDLPSPSHPNMPEGPSTITFRAAVAWLAGLAILTSDSLLQV